MYSILKSFIKPLGFFFYKITRVMGERGGREGDREKETERETHREIDRERVRHVFPIPSSGASAQALCCLK